uniref:ARAD1A04708p n=1 Tax=Blastobotrys adeninivorans TaxID=409370 RepID=A0A060T2Y7_BLAAD
MDMWAENEDWKRSHFFDALSCELEAMPDSPIPRNRNGSCLTGVQLKAKFETLIKFRQPLSALEKISNQQLAKEATIARGQYMKEMKSRYSDSKNVSSFLNDDTSELSLAQDSSIVVPDSSIVPDMSMAGNPFFDGTIAPTVDGCVDDSLIENHWTRLDNLAGEVRECKIRLEELETENSNLCERIDFLQSEVRERMDDIEVSINNVADLVDLLADHCMQSKEEVS